MHGTEIQGEDPEEGGGYNSEITHSRSGAQVRYTCAYVSGKTLVRTTRLPFALRDDPILEALFEIRFLPKTEGVSRILPGILYRELSESYGDIRPLPASQLPSEAFDLDPNLKYAAMTGLAGNNCAINIGDRVMQVSCSRPYPGWQEFSREIGRALRVLRQSSLASEIERVSLKYTNLISVGREDDLSVLDVELKVGGLKRRPVGTRLRVEILEGDLNSIVEIQTNTIATQYKGEPNEATYRGILVNVDTLSKSPIPDFWENSDSNIETLHRIEKTVFFSLLSEKALKMMNPIWENNDVRRSD